MKKIISMTLALAMVLTMGACSAKNETVNSGMTTTEAAAGETVGSDAPNSEAVSNASKEQEETAQEATDKKVGVLTMLNMTEDEMVKYREAESIARRLLTKEGYLTRNTKPIEGEKQIIFYDSLDAMLMALHAGDIGQMMVYYKTGQYLCDRNNDLILYYTFNFEKEPDAFADLVLSGHLSNDFSFLLMEGNEMLRDEISSAIKDMKADGTIDKLIKEQIDALLYGGEVKPVSMPVISDAETIKVAITGALPPMDYVAPDGTPAGFNTAVLAEISQRIGKNIELVVVDSIGRATALSSGAVDAVFWTRTNELSSGKRQSTKEEREADLEKKKADFSEEELEAFNEIRELIDFESYGNADMPEGTICTVPYYSDYLTAVMKKR